MYNIAVLVHNFTVEYADLIVKGIYRYFSDIPDARVYFLQTGLPHSSDGLYDYQYWPATEYLKSDIIDEFIIVSNTYCLYKSKEELKELFKPFFSKKIVSIGLNLEEQNIHYTTSTCDDVYDEVVSYLKNEQGCKNFNFFSASKVKSQEGEDRFNAFKKALKNNGLEFHEDWVLNGAFTMSSAKQELTERCHSKEDVKYDALLCANDLMCMGVLEYFPKIGIRVPEDVKVFGFDNTSHSILSVPAMATIDQSIEEQGFAAAEFGMKLLREPNKNHPQFINTKLKAIYRRSCGGEDRLEQKKHDALKIVLNHYNEVRRVGNLFDVIRGTSKLSDFAASFREVVDCSGFTAMSVFVLNEPIEITRESNFKIPYEARMLLHIDTEKNIAAYYENSNFFPLKDSLFPPELEKEPGRFIFQAVYLGAMQYGYLICKAAHTDFGMNSILLKVITSVIVQAYDYTKTMNQKNLLETMNKELKERNSDLNIRSKTDELTGLLNRRGFMEYGQRLIFFSEDIHTDGIVFFADLDGLKTINDKYGHENGDKAIKAAAEALRTAFRKMDIIGRLSGDEFGIIASGLEIEFMDKLREKIDSICNDLTKVYNFPFQLSLSVGAVKFSPASKDLSELLSLADQSLYEQKKIHHARLNHK
ncbi:MAG: GGDEF domain-containing protein [Treponema sp.]|nr:GGDEF domain-containing protein [Treponema sp.]